MQSAIQVLTFNRGFNQQNGEYLNTGKMNHPTFSFNFFSLLKD